MTDRSGYLLVGREVRKQFGSLGYFSGIVKQFDEEHGYYLVSYEDGDEEELELFELKAIICEERNINQNFVRSTGGRVGRKASRKVQNGSKIGSSSQRTTLKRGRKMSQSGSQRNEAQAPLAPSLSKSFTVNLLCKGRNTSAPSTSARKRVPRKQGWKKSLQFQSTEVVGLGIWHPSGASAGKGSEDDDDCCIISCGEFNSKVPMCGERENRAADEDLGTFAPAAGGDNSQKAKSFVEQDDNSSEYFTETSNSNASGGNVELPDSPLPPFRGAAEECPLSLPESSVDVPISGKLMAIVLSVYSFLRSFSFQLMLSPIRFETFLETVVSSQPSAILDAVMLATLSPVQWKFDEISCELKNNLESTLDWSLLDEITWPEFLRVFLTSRKFDCSTRLSSGNYFCQLSLEDKLSILQFLCDELLETPNIQSELIFREGNTWRRQPRSSASEAAKGSSSADSNSDFCMICGMEGLLVCCDGCPSAFHYRCVGAEKSLLSKTGYWFCPECKLQQREGTDWKPESIRVDCMFRDPSGRAYWMVCNRLLIFGTADDAEVRHYSAQDFPKIERFLVDSGPKYSPLLSKIRKEWNIPLSRPSQRNGGTSERQNGFPAMAVEEEFQEAMDMSEMEGLYWDNVFPTLRTELDTDREVSRIVNAVNSGVFQPSEEPAPARSSPAFDQLSLPSKSSTSVPAAKARGAPFLDFLWSLQSSLPAANPRAVDSWKPVFHPLSTDITFEDCLNPCLQLAASLDGAAPSLPALQRELSEYHSFGRAGRPKPRKKATGNEPAAECLVNEYFYGKMAADAALAVKASQTSTPSAREPSLTKTSPSDESKAFSQVCGQFQWPDLRAFPQSGLANSVVGGEVCGWCRGCRTNPSKRHCLFMLPEPSPCVDSSVLLLPENAGVESAKLARMALFVLNLEWWLNGLLSGPWEILKFRNLWRERVLKAKSFNDLKLPLAALVKNIRAVAFKFGRKSAPNGAGTGRGAAESADTDMESDRGEEPAPSASVSWKKRKAAAADVLSRRELVKAAKKGGLARISGLVYREGDPLASPEASVRADILSRIENAKTLEQLALQIRVLESSLKIKEIRSGEEPEPQEQGQGTGKRRDRDPEEPSTLPRIVRKRVTESGRVEYLYRAQPKRHKYSSALISGELAKRCSLFEAGQCSGECATCVRGRLLAAIEFAERRERMYRWVGEEGIAEVHLVREYEEQARVEGFVVEVARLEEEQRAGAQKEREEMMGRVDAAALERREEVLKRDEVREREAVKLAARELHKLKRQGGAQLSTGSSSHGSLQGTLCFSCNLAVQNAMKGAVACSLCQKTFHSACLLCAYQQSPFWAESSVCKYCFLLIEQSASAAEKGKAGPQEALNFKLPGSRRSGHGFLFRGSAPKAAGAVGVSVLPPNSNQAFLVCPQCEHCRALFDPDRLYIGCGKCSRWFHADSVGLTQSSVASLLSFHCHVCRRDACRLGPCAAPSTAERQPAPHKRSRTLTASELDKALDSFFDDTFDGPAEGSLAAPRETAAPTFTLASYGQVNGKLTCSSSQGLSVDPGRECAPVQSRPQQGLSGDLCQEHLLGCEGLRGGEGFAGAVGVPAGDRDPQEFACGSPGDLDERWRDFSAEFLSMDADLEAGDVDLGQINAASCEWLDGYLDDPVEEFHGSCAGGKAENG